MVEGDNLIHTVEKFRTQEVFQSFHGFFTNHIRITSAKTDTADSALRTSIGGHNDNGIFKVNGSALSIGNTTIVQHLQKHIQHIRVSLLDLIKEHHRIGLSADLLCQLASFIIAHIAGRRTDQLGNGVLFHEFRHI